jgi:hypothetical protein
VETKVRLENRKLAAARGAREYLEQTSLADLLTLIQFARMVKHAAKFRLRRNGAGNDPRAPRILFPPTLLARADEVIE